MLYPELTPQFCRQLKADGFPQPELAPFQYWYSLLDIPFVVVGQMLDKRWRVYNLQNERFSFIKGVSDEMVYSPNIADAFNFKYNKTP